MNFTKSNPLADGLDDEIRAEQAESDAFALDADLNADELINNISHIVDDLKADPTWFDFSNE